MSKCEMTNFLIRQDIFQVLKEKPQWLSSAEEPETEGFLGD